jgi:DUF4097 and DUF4098 domain-containing protein YvlB
MKNISLPIALLISGSAMLAQQPKPTLNCDNRHNGRNRAEFCEMREQTVPGGGIISVDASPNGGISVKGWDQNSVLVRAQVSAQADTDDQAKALAQQITVQTGGQIRAMGPAQNKENNWSVSFEIFVPTRSSVNLETVNGGVSMSDINGNLEFKTTNGGLHLQRVGGYVHGRTTNGGVSIELAGDHWDGQGLEVTTSNGGVSLKVPQNYSAQFEASTQNGKIRAAGLSTTEDKTHITTSLGRGGALLKVTTTNGGVSVNEI